MDEHEAIQRCLAGEIDAFAFIVRAYQSQLLSLAWNILGNGDDGRDAAQDALIAAYTHLAAYDPSRSFRTWLFSICFKRCLDFLRRRRSFMSFFRQESANRDHFYSTPGDDRPLEESPLFCRLLQKCGNKERAALILRINEDCSAREIAEVLGCSESTARAHLLNARRKLKRELQRMKARMPGSAFFKESP